MACAGAAVAAVRRAGPWAASLRRAQPLRLQPHLPQGFAVAPADGDGDAVEGEAAGTGFGHDAHAPGEAAAVLATLVAGRDRRGFQRGEPGARAGQGFLR